MSWDAYFDGNDWNYTHNTNAMLAAAYKLAGGEETEQCGGSLGDIIGPAWWDHLEGATAEQGVVVLDRFIAGLRSDPERFRAMNPENGWGSYDGVLGVLEEMRKASKAALKYEPPRCPECTADIRRWSVSG